MIFNQTEKQEKEYLQQVITTIHDTINTTSTSVKEHIDTLQEYKDYLWSNKDIDPHEIRSMRESILNHFALGENVIDKRRRLSKILDIPYFGRIDFQEKKDKSQVSPIYIGIHTFYDLNQKKNLIYDWRAPISSMFYDHELGEAFYSSPAGKINGTISLKRQYRIRKGKMEYMIESSVTVHDDILQKELCSNADNKMKNIVTTIQREQNQIIRNENASVLIIQGVAGSGKTSIALHRIAYLLYAQKGQISSKDSQKGNAQRGNQLAFGSFGIKSLETKWITGRQIEAARIAVTRYMQRQGQIWIRIFPDKPITRKPADVRMGKGKGAPEGFVAPVTPGRIIIEAEGVPYEVAKEALRLAAQKLPVTTKFIVRRDYDAQNQNA